MLGRKKSDEARKKMSIAKKGTMTGIKSNAWKGHWITPKGKFVRCEDAANAVKISKLTLARLCKRDNGLPLSIDQIKNNKYFLQTGARINQTPKEVGFGFEKVK